MCDIAEMYLTIKVTPKDRPYQRLLWRAMNQERAPEKYKFNRVVCFYSLLFQAQFVAQKPAETQRRVPNGCRDSTSTESTYAFSVKQ